MKLIFCFTFLFSFSNVFAAETTPQNESAFVIVLDPGHGGNDIGATRGSVKESDFTLKLALKINSLLILHQNIKPLMTRTTDLFLSLPDRVSFAEKNKAQLFVSLHANSNSSSLVKGAEFYLREKAPRDIFLKPSQSLGSRQLISPTLNRIVADLKSQAQLIQSMEFSEKLKAVWPQESPENLSYSLKRAPFYVITNSSMPSILIETGYLTNASDYQNLASAEYVDTLAQKIYKAILEYIKG